MNIDSAISACSLNPTLLRNNHRTKIEIYRIDVALSAVAMLTPFLAVDAARGFRRGMQPWRWNLNAAIHALTIHTSFNALQGRVNGGEFGGFTGVQRKFQIAFGDHLCSGVLRLPKVIDRSLGTANGAAAQGGNLNLQAGTLRQQLLFE